jgi:peptidoglycan-associated lipoprotein
MRLFFFLLLAISILTPLSCSFTKGIKSGEEAYERKQYSVAINLLEKEYVKNSSKQQKARSAYLMGQSYLKIQDYNEAKKWSQLAMEFGYGVEAMTLYAKTLKQVEDYDVAITVYRQIANQTHRKQEIDREISICNFAKELKNNPKPYKIDRLNQNSSVSEYAPVIYDNQFLVFTSERKEATGSSVYKWTGEKFSDLFVMIKTGSDVRSFDPVINSGSNEGAACFTSDMNTIYFTRCISENNGDAYCKLMVSHKIDGSWTEAEVLPFVMDKVNYGQPALFEHEEVLLFVSDIESPGGTSDIYYTEIHNDGSFSQPEKLPSHINSQGNEKFPTTDGDTLYFSSDYWPGMGGYDIFKAYLKPDGSWSQPENMGAPINSGGDDFSFIVDRTTKAKLGIIKEGFFVSSRNGDLKDDIYKYQELLPKPKEPDQPIIVKNTVFLTVNTYAPEYKIADDPNSGIFRNLPLGNSLINIEDETGKRIRTNQTDGNGFFVTEIPENKTIKVIAANAGYLNAVQTVSTFNLVFDTLKHTATVNLSLVLNKIYEDKEIILDNIYYDYDKWNIKEEAIPTLDLLVVLMKENPQIKIQLSSHTDCRGDDAYNLELSQKRAQSVVDYLIHKGISSQRLIPKGYGETMLIEKCICEICTEKQHQINRRTTFKIIK